MVTGKVPFHHGALVRDRARGQLWSWRPICEFFRPHACFASVRRVAQLGSGSYCGEQHVTDLREHADLFGKIGGGRQL